MYNNVHYTFSISSIVIYLLWHRMSRSAVVQFPHNFSTVFSCHVHRQVVPPTWVLSSVEDASVQLAMREIGLLESWQSELYQQSELWYSMVQHMPLILSSTWMFTYLVWKNLFYVMWWLWCIMMWGWMMAVSHPLVVHKRAAKRLIHRYSERLMNHVS
jgi:hypothetical protein